MGLTTPFATKNDELRLVTQSVAGQDWAFVIGETWLIRAADVGPDALLQNSAVIDISQRTPYSKIYDPAWFATLSKPRPEPPPERLLVEADILRMFNWTPRQLGVAMGSVGFPQSKRTKEDPPAKNPFAALWGEGKTSHTVWPETPVLQWAEVLRSLGPI